MKGAKFWDMSDDLTDPHIPWEGVIKALVEGGYSGFLSSEYEGRRERACAVVRRRRNRPRDESIGRQEERGSKLLLSADMASCTLVL